MCVCVGGGGGGGGEIKKSITQKIINWPQGCVSPTSI